MAQMNPRLRTLRGRFVALIAASAVALGLIAASAVPARAETDGQDIGRILFGLAAIALIAKALDKKDDKPKPPVVVVPPKPPHPPIVIGPNRVPAACAIEVTGLGRDRIGYTESCLQSYGFRNLPQNCAVAARIYGRPDRLFPKSCLEKAGYRLGR